MSQFNRKDYVETDTLKAQGSPSGGKYKWDTAENKGFCKTNEKKETLKFIPKKPGIFKVGVKYTKGGESTSKKTAEVIIPFELSAYFKTEFQLQSDKEAIKTTDGKALEYVILQADNNDPNHYDFKSHKAMTYIQVWLEEYDVYHKDHGEKRFALKCDDDCLNFYKNSDGSQKCTHLTLSELTRKHSGTNRKGIQVYLSGKGIQQDKKDVKIWLELDKVYLSGATTYKDIKKGRIYLENSENLSFKIESFDTLLKNDIKKDALKIVNTNSSTQIKKFYVAAAKAGLNKCGTKTFENNNGVFYYNINKDKMTEALTYIFEHNNSKLIPYIDMGDGKDPVQMKPGHLPANKQIQTFSREGNGEWNDHYISMVQESDKSTVFSKKQESGEYSEWKQIPSGAKGILYRKTKTTIDFEEYFKLIQENLKEMKANKGAGEITLHPSIQSEIKKRLKYFQSNRFVIDTTSSKGGPGCHAEVLAVNDIMIKYFESEGDTALHKITEVTYQLFKGKVIKFAACVNCAAILSRNVRIPTGINKD